MQRFESSSYGDAFADVYDEWYAGVSDIDATVAALQRLAAGQPILELGIGTGRIAVPLAAAGANVSGIDASNAMLDRLRAKQPVVPAVLGDMVEDLPAGPFGLVFAAYNTLFNLTTHARQQACFDAVAARLLSSGCFVIEAFVPDPQRPAGGTVGVRSVAVDRVVLSVDVHRPQDQTVDAQLVELTESGGVRLRPAMIRYSHPAELDEMAKACGMVLSGRWEDFSGTPFDADSPRHVSVYRPSADRWTDQ